jgi:hypothetical protein
MQYKKKEYGFNIITETEKVEQLKQDLYESSQQIKYEQPPYTEDALIIQAILEYSIDVRTEKYYTRKEITDNHLFPKYCEIFSKIKVKSKDGVKKAFIHQAIKTHLEKLTYLELVESEEYEVINKEISIKYRFTKLARIIAFLLLWDKNKTIDRETTEKVLDQLCDFYNSLHNSHAYFCLIFLRHCKQNKVLSFVLRYLINLFFDSSTNNTNKDEFLNKIKFLNTIFIDDLKLWKVYETSLDYLSKRDFNTYEVFLLHLKLFLEEIVENKSRKFKDFEIERLEKAQELDTIVLEGYCSFCIDFSVYSMQTTKYLGDYIRAFVSQRYISDILCQKCNRNYLHFEQIVDSQSTLGYFDNSVLDLNQENEKDLIKKIFEFDQNENRFTEKAQQYQWIIQFLSDGDVYHNITDTQDWIFSKVPLLFNFDVNDTPSENKKNTNGLFNRHINNLEKWNLIESIPDKSSKGGVNTRKFCLSVFGKLVASIIETILNEDKREGYDELFDSWKLHLTAYPSSLNLFCVRYLDKCKEKEIFDEFAEFYLKSFTSGKNRQVQNVNDLFTQMILVKFKDGNKNSILFDIWKQSFNELDEKNRKLFSNYMRIYINRITSNNAFDYGEYETKRFEVKDKIDHVIAEARCILCSDYQYIAVNVFSYLSYFFDHPDENIKELYHKIKCRFCQATIKII